MRKSLLVFFTTLLLLWQGNDALHAQNVKLPANQQKSLTGSIHLDLNTLSAATIYKQLQSSLFTDLSVEVEGQTHIFRVSVSNTVQLSGSNELAYEGYESNDRRNRVFIMVSKDRCYTFVRLHDKEYTIAPSADIQQSAFMEHTRELTAANGISASPMVTTGNYSMVDMDKIQSWAEKLEPSVADRTSKSCIANEHSDSELFGKTYDYSGANDSYQTGIPGLIGKRDLYLHIYDYGDMSSYDYQQVVDQLTTDFFVNSDTRFSNIRLVIIKHKRGETNNTIIDNQNVSWSTDPNTFLTSFENKLKQSIVPPRQSIYQYKNEFYMLLTRGSWDNSIRGIGSTGGNASAVCCWWDIYVRFTTPAHEFSHNLDALHTSDKLYSGGWWYTDLMNDAFNPFMGSRIGYHINQDNKDRIQNKVNAVSIGDEVLDGTSIAGVRDWNYAEDLYTVSDNTSTTVVTPTPTGPLFNGQKMPYGQTVCQAIKAYKIWIPQRGSQAQTYMQFRITHADYDTYLYVLDEDGNFVASDDDGGGNMTSYISGYFNAAKNYYVIVGGYDDLEGNFTLKARYGWYNEGWGKDSSSIEPDKTSMFETEDGTLIESADFGLTDKITTGLTESIATYKTSLEIYPNPVANNQVLHVSDDGLSSQDQYTLVNLVGETLATGKLTNVANNLGDVKLPSLQKGIYLLHVIHTQKATTSTTKFTVE